MSFVSAMQISGRLSPNLSVSINALISIFGLIGNLLNIIVFINHRFFHRNQSIFYLIIDSIVNISRNLLDHVTWILLFIFDITADRNSWIWCKLKNMLTDCFTLISIFIMCFAAYDQFCSTSPLYYLREKSTLKLAHRLTMISVVCAIIFAIPLLAYYTIDSIDGCIVKDSIFLFYYSFIHIPLLFGMIPVCISLILSFLAFRNVRRIVRQRIPIVRRRLDRQLTAMILIRIVFFVICTFPYIVYRIYSLNHSSQSMTTYIIELVCSSLATVNTAGSFYLFSIFSVRYRHQIKSVLVKNFWKRLRRKLCLHRAPITPMDRTMARVYSIELER